MDIVIADIKDVAKALDIKITIDQAMEVLKRYPEAQQEDPQATWNLVVEDLVYRLLEEED